MRVSRYAHSGSTSSCTLEKTSYELNCELEVIVLLLETHKNANLRLNYFTDS